MKSFQSHAGSSRSLVELTFTFNSPVTNRLLDYWNALRGGKGRPRWSDFELMDLYEIAPTMVIRDAVEDGAEFYCRYFGTQMVQFLGFDASGKLLRECYAPASAEVLKKRMTTAMTRETPLRVAGIIDFIDTTVPKPYEAIWLGVNNEAGEPAHAVSVFDIDYQLTAEDLARYSAAQDVEAIDYANA